MTGEKESEERDLGPQPLDAIMTRLGLSSHDLVAASVEQLTHKQVQKGRKGRRLSPHLQQKILRALSQACGETFRLSDLFNY